MPDPGVRNTTTGSLVDAFKQWLTYGSPDMAAYIKSVAATYLGKDYSGQPVYRFTYAYQSGSRLVYANRVQAVSSSGGSYGIGSFTDPNYSRTPGGETIGDPTQIDTSGGTSASSTTALQTAQDYAYSIIAKYAHLMSTDDLNQVNRTISSWTGSPEGLRKYALFIEQDLGNNKYEISPTAIPIYADAEDQLDPFDFLGGDGGGFAGPVYKAPDRRVVEDFVRGRLVSLVGLADDKYVQSFTDLYMRDHKRNWDSQSHEIDPAQSVTEAIRKTGEYLRIHKNRPEGEDENSWIAARRAEAERAGLNVGELDQFAINQATAAGDLVDIGAAAGYAQLQNTGRAPAFLDQKFRNVATAMFQKVGR